MYRSVATTLSPSKNCCVCPLALSVADNVPHTFELEQLCRLYGVDPKPCRPQREPHSVGAAAGPGASTHTGLQMASPTSLKHERSPFGSLPLDAEAHELASKLKIEFPQLSIYGGSNTNPRVTMRMGVKALQAKGFPNASEKKECKGPSRDYTCSGVRGALGEVVRYLLDIWEAEDSSNLIRGLAEFLETDKQAKFLMQLENKGFGEEADGRSKQGGSGTAKGKQRQQGKHRHKHKRHRQAEEEKGQQPKRRMHRDRHGKGGESEQQLDKGGQ